MIPQVVLLILFFTLNKRVGERPKLVRVVGMLMLVCLCLAHGSHELDRQTLLYQSNMKAGMYLAVAASNVSGKVSFIAHASIAFFVPLAIQLILMNEAPRQEFIVEEDEEYDMKSRGYEEGLVYLRQALISTMLLTVYYLQLRKTKADFIRSCLHELNEKSIGDVLDRVSEPILIVKRKHKISMKPKYINKAAREILQLEKLNNKKRE